MSPRRPDQNRRSTVASPESYKRAVTNERAFTLAILEGGRGTRLGVRDKGSLRCEGATLVERLIAAAPGAQEVLRVGGSSLPDVMPARGAPGGLLTALELASTPWVLLVACDMPHVASAAVDLLVSMAGVGVDAVAFDEGAPLAPLPSLWHVRTAPKVRARLSASASFQDLFAQVSVARIARARLAAVDPLLRSLASVNDADDAKALNVEL